MTHPLALSVINESMTYAARKANHLSMTKRQYRAYILEIVNAAAKAERRAFDVHYKPRDIDTAVEDVLDHHERAHRDDAGSEEDEANGMNAVIYLDSLDGKVTTADAARIAWSARTTDERAQTMQAYDLFTRAPQCDNAPEVLTQ